MLVVDDDPDMSAYLALLLKGEGMDADTAADGAQALERMRAATPDLVLLDVMMPGMSGFELCRRLKSDEATALVPVVLVTALEDGESRVKGIEAGADDFLSKPVRREELIARVKTLRRLHETRKELEGRRLAAEVQRKEALRKAFSRYISPRLADRIAEEVGDGANPFRGPAQRAHVVALFADLRGFTRFTEQHEVGQVVRLLNEYFGVLTDTAYQHDGTIFSMGGDSLLVGFNVPFPQPDAAERAWQTALEMVARFTAMVERWRQRQDVPLGIGVGICAGEVIIGNVGSEHFASYTIIGNPVNTAYRLMEVAAAGEIVVCGPYYDSIRHLIHGHRVEGRGDVTLRGRSAAVPVFAISAEARATA
ncbi:MAG: adenylate/guanylate cyclase domain-containing protein [Burkholderiales bacterium]